MPVHSGGGCEALPPWLPAAPTPTCHVEPAPRAVEPATSCTSHPTTSAPGDVSRPHCSSRRRVGHRATWSWATTSTEGARCSPTTAAPSTRTDPEHVGRSTAGCTPRQVRAPTEPKTPTSRIGWRAGGFASTSQKTSGAGPLCTSRPGISRGPTCPPRRRRSAQLTLRLLPSEPTSCSLTIRSPITSISLAPCWPSPASRRHQVECLVLAASAERRCAVTTYNDVEHCMSRPAAAARDFVPLGVPALVAAALLAREPER